MGCFKILVLLNVLWLTTFTTAYLRPIIGVVSQKSSGGHGDTGIPADYIKWIESAGGGVVPIRDQESEEYYEKMFTYTNGVLLPGGGVDLFTSGYANASRYFYEMALKAYDKGDYYPVWGTCLGFQELSALTAGVLVTTNASVWDKSLPLNLTEEYKESRMFGTLPDDVKTYLMKDNVTPNFHSYGVTVQTYNSNSRLKKFFKVLSTNVASNGKEFLSTVEAHKYPVYGIQWHPEKSNFLWNSRYTGLVHDFQSIRVSQHFANFFISEARKNKHKFPSVEMEAKSLINNYPIWYTADSSFEEMYFFNYTIN
ncbi:gamma-glutamyl hydrolase-like [Mytilus trossulus]|uniref:gamma-glutamyl hydrolase-like n=1 Tax=Mytilus trossulus TaxID=6551 RepID=UPI003003F859